MVCNKERNLLDSSIIMILMVTILPPICNIVVQVVRNWVQGTLVFHSGVSQGLVESALMFAPHGGWLNFVDPLVMTCTTIMGVVMWL